MATRRGNDAVFITLFYALCILIGWMDMLKYIIAVTNTALLPILVAGAFIVLYGVRTAAGSKKTLWAGFWTGVVASAVLVLLKKNTGFVVREYYNLAVLLPCLAAEAVLVFMIWFPRRDPVAGPAGKIFAAVSFIVMALWVGYGLPDVLFYPFDFSVGMDSIFNTRYAYKVIGYSIGLILVTLSFFAFMSILRQMRPTVVKLLFQAVIAVFIARQLLWVLQIGLGRNLLPRSPFIVGFTIDWLNRSQWFMFALMAVGAVCAAVVYLKNRLGRFTAANPALLRKLKAAARRQRRWCAVLGAALIVALLSVTVGAAYENQEVVLDPPREIQVADGRILIPVEMIDDGKLHRFKYTASDGTEMRYIVIKKNETAYGVGLDACDICGASGYYERNDQVICILCDVVMNKSTIGFPGGCNPVPLGYRVEDGHMRIETKDLEKDVWRFKE